MPSSQSTTIEKRCPIQPFPCHALVQEKQKDARRQALKKGTAASPPNALAALMAAQHPTSTTSAPDTSDSASAAAIGSSPRLEETDPMREMLQALQSIHRVKSGRVVPASAILSSFQTHTTTNLIKGFAKKETNKIELNHALRAIELASYRGDLTSKRRLMLFLAYAMASVFTALSLWVVCFVLREQSIFQPDFA